MRRAYRYDSRVNAPRRIESTPVTAPVADHAEGPIWDARAGVARWVDMPRGLVNRIRIGDGGPAVEPVGDRVADAIRGEHAHLLGSGDELDDAEHLGRAVDRTGADELPVDDQRAGIVGQHGHQLFSEVAECLGRNELDRHHRIGTDVAAHGKAIAGRPGDRD